MYDAAVHASSSSISITGILDVVLSVKLCDELSALVFAPTAPFIAARDDVDLLETPAETEADDGQRRSVLIGVAVFVEPRGMTTNTKYDAAEQRACEVMPSTNYGFPERAQRPVLMDGAVSSSGAV